MTPEVITSPTAVETVTFTLNGQSLTVPKGTSVLQAAIESGVKVPYFCYHPKLKSVGSCRMCYVEIEKFPKLMVSCCTEATNGMVVHTDSDLVKRGRKAVIEFTLINHPLDCPTCDKGGECDLQNLTFAHGYDDSRFDFQKYRFVEGESRATFDDLKIGPEIVLNRNRCILCYKCVRANKEAFGEYDLGAYERGNITEINAAPGEEVNNPYSGNLVEICPVGALTNSDWRYKIRVWLTQTSPSIDLFTSSGSNITFTKERHQNKIFRTTSRRNDAIDDGWLPDVSRYGYQIAMSDSRLKTPLLKKNGQQVAVSWDEALQAAAKRLSETKEKKGAVAIGGIAAPYLDSAALYRFASLLRDRLETPNLDFRFEYKQAGQTADSLFHSLTNQPFSIEAIDTADVVVVVGSDLHREHLNEYLRIRKAFTRNDARVFFLNPYETKGADCATLELVYKAGTDEVALTALVLAAIESGQLQSSEFPSQVTPKSLPEAAAACGCDADELRVVAKSLAQAKRPCLIAGELITRSTQREQIAAALCNLNTAFGISSKGQIAALARHANSIGAARLGLTPQKNGLPVDGMLQSAAKGELSALIVLGAPLLQVSPDRTFTENGLKKLECLIVADLFESELTREADIVFPLSTWAEHAGSFVNLEGKSQSFVAAITPRFESRPAAVLLEQLSALVGTKPVESASAVDEQIRTRLTSALPSPLPNRYLPVHGQAESAPAGSVPLYVSDDPHHYVHLTEHAPSLTAFASECYAEIAPATAKRLGLKAGDRVRVETAGGKLIVPVHISTVLEREVVLIPRNFHAEPVMSLVSRSARTDWVKVSKVEG